MNTTVNRFAGDAWTSLGGEETATSALSFTGGGNLPSKYAVTDFASAAIGAAALSVAELVGRVSPGVPAVVVDRRLSSFWFGWSIRPIGWERPMARDPLTGEYRTKDGWILIHADAAHHWAAAERVLGKPADKASMAEAVASWAKLDLETAIVEGGGCAAEMRSCAEWAAHPQGTALVAEPLVHMIAVGSAMPSSWTPTISRPLAGLRVLDLTRIIAGPVATRFLAGYGADVLRIDPPGWEEPRMVPEFTVGKRCARLDLEEGAARKRFEALLSEADILVHGYRADALDHLGYGAAARRALSPRLIDVSLSAYGWSGPWATRRGYDSLVQMSSGIADAGMRWRQADRPTPLPVQALDHATGYLMAATVIRAVTRRLDTRVGTEAHLSLARTAKLLVDGGDADPSASIAAETLADVSPIVERTDWGEAQRLESPATVARVPMYWTQPARELGSAAPEWK